MSNELFVSHLARANCGFLSHISHGLTDEVKLDILQLR